MTTAKEWITIAALADATGKSERTVRRWIKRKGWVTETRETENGQHAIVVRIADALPKIQPMDDTVTTADEVRQ